MVRITLRWIDGWYRRVREEVSRFSGHTANSECHRCGAPIRVEDRARSHGVPFNKPLSVFFCSDECERHHHNAVRRKATEIKVCNHCGATFTAKRADAVYCSARCRQAARRSRASSPPDP